MRDHDVPTSSGLGGFDSAASVVLAWSFAVAGPLLDVLGRQAQFFVAHGLAGVRLVGLAVAITIVVPVALATAVGLLQRHVAVAGPLAHGLVFGGLATIWGYGLLRGVVGGPTAVLLALLLSAAAIVLLHRSRPARTVARIGLVAPVAIGGIFVALTPASALVFEGTPEPHRAVAIDRPAPIMFVVLDELPISSLLDGEGEINAEVYPNFARLAAGSTWFRNAWTVAEGTGHALPAIVSGMLPEPDRLPIAAHHRDTIFTLLGDVYEIRAMEVVTDICPAAVCEADARRGDVSLLASDLAIVYGHIVLPRPLAARLPELGERWAGFGDGVVAEPERLLHEELDEDALDEIAREAVHDDWRVMAREFIAGIRPASERPTLDYLHILAPHSPWRYVPSLHEYPPRSFLPGRGRFEWHDDEWLIAQAWQRHLLQLGAVDTLLGELLDHLDGIGLLDDALLVITADHGIAFAAEEPLRAAKPATLSEIVAVPLFVKAPGQSLGEVVDRPVELIDIVPGIADLLGADLPWVPDGQSLFDSDAPRRTVGRLWKTTGRWEAFSSPTARPNRALERRRRLLGELGGDHPLHAIGPHGGLVGARVDDVVGDEDAPLRVQIEDETAFRRVDLRAATAPLLVRGRLVTPPDEPIYLAIAVNEQVGAVTRTYEDADGATAFYAMIPIELLEDGANSIEVLVVDAQQDPAVLRRLAEG